MNIHLHIERLVVDETLLAAGGREALQAVVVAELTRLLDAGGLSAAWHAGGMVPSIRGEPIVAVGNGEPAALGAQVARAIYAGIGNAGDARPVGKASRGGKD
jgi:hypothetical protein